MTVDSSAGEQPHRWTNEAFARWLEAVGAGILSAPDREFASKALQAPLRAGDTHPVIKHAAYTVAPLVLILQTIVAANRKRNDRIKKLEQRLSTLTKASEERRALTYRGVWAAHERYEPGDVVTMAGSMWYCQEPTSGVRPGEASSISRAWLLAVKRGRDGRDGRSDGALRELVQQLAARVEALEQQLKQESTP